MRIRIFSNVLCLVLLCCTLLPGRIGAHPGHTSEELVELNEYVMALQLMRHGDVKADQLFDRWQVLRKASWRIRDLTDQQDLPIDHPEVVKQIAETHRLRTALLKDCRTFFAAQTDELPTARIHVSDDIQIMEAATRLVTAVGSRGLFLIEITSGREDHSTLRLSCEADEQILFWSKDIVVTKEHPRYTFAYFAPIEPGLSEASLSIQWKEDVAAEVKIRADGTLPARYDWYNHRPDESIYNMAHVDEPAKSEGATVGDREVIRFRVRDSQTGEHLPVRVEVRDEDENAYWAPLSGPSYAVNREKLNLWKTPLWTFQQGPFFYIGGDAELGVSPLGKKVRIYRGFEYTPVSMDVPNDGNVDVVLERWIDMPSKGWYSGHTHIHTTDVGLPVQYSRFWPLVTQAEDLGVSSILTLQGERKYHAIYAAEYPQGTLQSHSTPDHLITYGAEYRNNPYGHLSLLGLDYLITPVSTGALGELGGPDYPPNAFVLDEALQHGGTTVANHFGNYIVGDGPIGTSYPSTGFEMPVNVALGKIHLAEIYGMGGQLEVWYKFLNAGFDLPATAGPDWMMKDAPRAYVFLADKPFSVENWLEGLRLGRSFVTRGPMLFFTVDGNFPGEKIHCADKPCTVTIHASALTPEGSKPVEIVVNGKVVANSADFEQTMEVDESSWIAARTEGAHSNPVFVTVQGKPRISANELEEFIKITDRLAAWVTTKGLFESPAQRSSVLNALEEGRVRFENMIRRAKSLEER